MNTPYTPATSTLRRTKNSLACFSTPQLANTPQKMTIAVSNIISTEMASTPMLYSMFSIWSQTVLAVKWN